MTRESFEQEVQQLIGLQLRRVRYYELPGGWPCWNAHQEFDSLDHGLDLTGDDASYFITWDSTFWNYGLRVRPGTLLNFLSAGQFTDVSEGSRWSALLGQRVIHAQVNWEPISYSVDGWTADSYPQDLVLTFEAGRQVYLSAAQPQGPQKPLFTMSDHVVVFFESEQAQRYLNGFA